MAQSVKFSDEFIKNVKIHAAVQSRSIPKQIEHWAKIGQIVEENPDLPPQFVHDILLAQAELEDGLGIPFTFE